MLQSAIFKCSQMLSNQCSKKLEHASNMVKNVLANAQQCSEMFRNAPKCSLKSFQNTSNMV